MKKAVAAAASSAAGFAVVLGAHAALSGSRGLAASLQKAAAAGSAGRGASSSGRAPSAGATAPTVARTAPVQGGAVASAVGTSEQYGYGVLSVRVTVEGSRITDVSVASLQTAESYSQMLAQQVVPVLRQEVLQAQGVQVNGISGATYTSEAYLLSVQSALSKLHV
jgi:uncharacterized protein with FMN-binding domain